MGQKSNGDYFYVESETVNDILDGFQIYDDGSGNIVFHDEANDSEYKINAGSGLDAPSGTGYYVDGTQVVGAQESALTAADGSTVDDTYGTEERDVIQNNVTRIAEIETALTNHGLIA